MGFIVSVEAADREGGTSEVHGRQGDRNLVRWRRRDGMVKF